MEHPARAFVIGRSYGVCFSADEERLAVVGYTVDLFDVSVGKRVAKAHPFKHPSSVDVSKNGDVIAVKSTSGDIALLDGQTLDLLQFIAGSGGSGGGSDALLSARGGFVVDGTWGEACSFVT